MVSVFVFVFVVASALGVSMGGAARLISIAAVAQALFDLWVDGVMPHAVQREVGP